MNTLLAICGALLGLVVVAGDPGSAAESPGTIKLRPLAKGSFTAMHEARQEVVKDPKRWKAIWTEHAGKSTSPVPDVDFSKEYVIVASMGQRPTGGYSIRIIKAEVTADKLKIYIQKKSPQKGSMTIQVLTAPFEFVAIPKSDLPVVFVDADNAGKR